MARYNPIRLLNSVPFGIGLMAFAAVYIAVGLGRPWLRGIDGWPIFGNWFDKTDQQFLNAWPLRAVLILLVLNLVVVTWRRIPLVPAKYGAWCVNTGTILLVCGTSIYFHFKVQGQVRIYMDPNAGPNTVDHFYDRDLRSLYVRIGQEEPVEIPLPTLPRYADYDQTLGNERALAGRGLMGITPTLEITDQATGDGRKENLAELIGCKGQQLKFDVVGFYPHAEVSTGFTIDPGSQVTGVEVVGGDDWWLVGSDPRFREDDRRTPADLRHVDADGPMVAALTDAAGKLFHLDVSTPNQPVTAMDVQVGQSYPVGKTGYTLKIERFTPNFPMFGTREVVADLTMLVTTPTQTFRRMVLQDKPVQTDFKLDGQDAGPMGTRQKAPLDTGLVIDFHVHDPYRLLPERNAIRHTLLTPPGGNELIDIVAGNGDAGSAVTRFPTGVGDIEIQSPIEQLDAVDAATNAPVVKIHVERRNHLKPVDHVKITRHGWVDKTDQDEGLFQLVKLKVTMGDWTGMVYAPFAQEAGDRLQKDQWHGGFVLPPGAIAPLQVQLGNTRRPLPARLTLDQFKLTPPAKDPNAAVQDCVSTIALSTSDTDTGAYTDVAKVDHPISFAHGNWVFSQAGYDLIDHEWIELRVDNRPAIYVMLAGCVMIFLGLVYWLFIGQRR